MRRTLHVNTADAVVWVIGSNIVGTRASADIIVLGRVRSVPRGSVRWASCSAEE